LPSLLTVIGGWQLTIPEALGAQVKLTVTSLLFHPAALGAGFALALMMGAVFSMFNDSEAVAVFPA
jgi:hypothetical protein